MPLSTATRQQVELLRDRYPHPRSAVLPSLWAVQHELGWLAPEGMAEVAELLGLKASEVAAVSSFYSMYFQRPGGKHHVLVCVNVSCALRGSDAIVEHLERSLGCPSGSTTADGEFTWEATVECLGACGGAPAMQVDHHFHEDLTPEGVDGIIERTRRSGSGFEPHAGAAPGPTPGPRLPTGRTPPPPHAEGPAAGSAEPGRADAPAE